MREDSITDKHDKHLKATIHIDLDGASHIYKTHGWSYKCGYDHLYMTGLQRALDFLEKANLHATLFVIASDIDVPYKRELIEEAVERGHEIASHSLTHSKLTTLSRESKQREIMGSRDRIESELGVDVYGFRAPSFDIDQESLELIAAAGYVYDSSLLPISSTSFNSCEGGNEIRESPYLPLMNSNLLELPIPIYKPLQLPFHPCYSIVLGMWYFKLGLRRFVQKNVPLVLLYHLTDFADPLPGKYLYNWRAKLYTLSHKSVRNKLQRCECMLELVQRKYQFVNTLSLLEEYKKLKVGNDI